MSRYVRAGMALGLALVACQSSARIAADFSTPEGAVLRLEQALSAGDLEAAMACRDFEVAARVMLERRLSPEQVDTQMLADNAELLRVAFAQEIDRKGYPDYSQTLSRFTGRQPFRGRSDMVVLTEELTLVDHQRQVRRYLVGRGPDGWRVIGPAD